MYIAPGISLFYGSGEQAGLLGPVGGSEVFQGTGRACRCLQSGTVLEKILGGVRSRAAE